MTNHWAWMNHIVDVPEDLICDFDPDNEQAVYFKQCFIDWLKDHRELFEGLIPRHNAINLRGEIRFFFERSDQALLFKLTWGVK